MRNIRTLITVAVLSVALTGCLGATGQGGGFNKQLGGGLLGGALGGWAGSQIGGGTGRLAATAGGAILGMLIGSSIGASLDRIDQMSVARTTQRALETAPTGRSVSWSNPDRRRQTYGHITPRRTYTHYRTRQVCREYTHDITIGGRRETMVGRACRQSDGTWKNVS